MRDLYDNGLDYLSPLQPILPEWMERIKQDGIARKVPIVRDDMGQFIRMLCSIKKPDSILEIGCGISYATHWMLLGYNHSKITALDYNQDRLNQCENYLQMSGFKNQVELKCCWAEDFFKDNTRKYDLIFQDSTKKGYAGMIDHCYQCLREE
ncbi:methyltransferase domain-containing protein, partial [bacterium]|nr:methyltransferase domain-containing protein [bacterium]